MISTKAKITALRAQTLEPGCQVQSQFCPWLAVWHWARSERRAFCLPAASGGCGHGDFLPSLFGGMAESRLRSIKLAHWKSSKPLADAGTTGLPASLVYLLSPLFSKKGHFHKHKDSNQVFPALFPLHSKCKVTRLLETSFVQLGISHFSSLSKP